jgi:kynureninase
MRKWLIAAAIVGVALMIGLALAVSRFQTYVEERRDWVAGELSAALRRSVSFGDIAVSLRGGLSVAVTNLRVAEDPTFGDSRDPARRGSHITLGHDEGWRIDQALIQELNILPDFRRPDNIRLGIAPLYNTFEEVYTAAAGLKTVVEEQLYENYTREMAGVT